MRFYLLSMAFFSFIAGSQAQHTLHIEVNDFTRSDTIFLSGSINNWNPGDKNYQLKRINYFRREITLRNLPAGQYAFKLTKGSLKTVEATATGDDIPNRIINLHRDTTVLFSVQGWMDFKDSPLLRTDSARMANALNRGFHYLNTNLDSSYKYALETFSLSSKVSPQLRAYAVNLQGEVLLKLGNTDQALELFKEGLRIREVLNNPNDSGSISFLYNQVGNVYWQMNDTASAIQNYHLSMRWTPYYVYIHPLHEGICNRLCNIGRAFLGKHQLDSAKWYATQSAQVGDKLSAITDLFRGDIEISEGNLAQALVYFHSSVRLGRDHDRNLDIVLEAYERMSHVFKILNQQDSVIVYARLSFVTAKALQNNEAASRSGVLLATMFKALQHYDSAFYYQQEVIEALEKQFNQEKERETLNSYFNEKIKEKEFIAEKNRYSAIRWVYGLSGGLIGLILIALAYRIRLKSNYDRRMKEIEMRALRAQMNPHFIFNCLGSINRYIVKSDTKTASNYLTKFSKLIRLILDNSASNHISLDVEIQTLQLYLDMESLRFDHGFDYEIQKDENLQEANIFLPSMLIQPYVENAIWHGLLQKEEKGKLWVRFERINGHTLQAEIEDNGIGRQRAAALKSKGTVKHKSYGMQINSDRIQIINHLYKLNNSITIHDLVNDRGEAMGTKIILNLPI